MKPSRRSTRLECVIQQMNKDDVDQRTVSYDVDSLSVWHEDVSFAWYSLLVDHLGVDKVIVDKITYELVQLNRLNRSRKNGEDVPVVVEK